MPEMIPNPGDNVHIINNKNINKVFFNLFVTLKDSNKTISIKKNTVER